MPLSHWGIHLAPGEDHPLLRELYAELGPEYATPIYDDPWVRRSAFVVPTLPQEYYYHMWEEKKEEEEEENPSVPLVVFAASVLAEPEVVLGFAELGNAYNVPVVPSPTPSAEWHLARMGLQPWRPSLSSWN